MEMRISYYRMENLSLSSFCATVGQGFSYNIGGFVIFPFLIKRIYIQKVDIEIISI